MQIGLIEKFDIEKGWGLIINSSSDKIYLHISKFKDNHKFLIPKVCVLFHEEKDFYHSMNSAHNCEVLCNMSNISSVLSFLGKSCVIELKETIKLRNSTNTRNVFNKYNLIKLSLEQVLINIDDERLVLNYIIDYFDTILDRIYFIEFCYLIESVFFDNFDIKIQNSMKSKAYKHFGENCDDTIIFQIWLHKKFKFINNKFKSKDEIPLEILNKFINKISFNDLDRIYKYSYGPAFCKKFIAPKFRNLQNLSLNELLSLNQYIKYFDKEYIAIVKNEIKKFYNDKVYDDIINQAKSIKTIYNSAELYNYKNKLLSLIPNKINDVQTKKIISDIEKILIYKCNEDLNVYLWVNNKIHELPWNIIKKEFLFPSNNESSQILIMNKLSVIQSFELLKSYQEISGWEKSFILIEKYLEKKNLFTDSLSRYKKLHDINFRQGKIGYELFVLFVEYALQKIDEEEKYNLLLKGFVNEVPFNLVLRRIDILKKNDIELIIEFLDESRKLILLRRLIDYNDENKLSWLCNIAINSLNNYSYSLFDKDIFENIDYKVYFYLWSNHKALIFPFKYINEYLNDDYSNYNCIDSWLVKKLVTKEDIIEFLLSYLRKQILVSDRIIFNKHFNHIKKLVDIDIECINKIIEINRNIYNVIIWYIDHNRLVDFDSLKSNFIYFNPDDQVRIIRKLFMLKAKNEFELTMGKLNELTRFDLNMYEINFNFNPDLPINISTDIIIKALISFSEKGKFLVESELLDIILKDIKNNKKQKFSLDNYFEKCSGRVKAIYDSDYKGVIKKISFINKQLYFAFKSVDGLFNEIIKKLPECIWNKFDGSWCVPSKFEDKVLEFAKFYRFQLDLSDDKYNDNPHLVTFENYGIPDGITFCDGRFSKTQHTQLNREFRWCLSKPCFSNCQISHSTEEWESYTLLDFCEILSLNINETNRMGDFIPNGKYYQFISLVNRFNRILDKLYCKDCGEILYPVDTSHFASHTVVRFHCVNNTCSNNDEIYLNHCLNGQCTNVIDSRVSQKCSNDLFICDKCGSCCSHDMFLRRLTNLQTTGGYIHQNLINCVDNKLGHLERAEYFCYKCSLKMVELENDFFKCENCNESYDTRKYRFKRSHIQFRDNKYSSINNIEDILPL